MNPILILSLILPVAILSKYFAMSIPKPQQDLIKIYEIYGTKEVPPNLLRAFSIVESGEKRDAYNPRDPSFGLMQILCTGTNVLYVDGWPPSDCKTELFQPYYNVKIGSQIAKYNIVKYGLFRGVIAYNNWSARVGSIPLKSLDYFMKVYITYLRLGGQTFYD